MKNNQKQILGQKYRWLIPEIDNSLIDEIVNNFGISKIIALFLVSRGKINSADVKSFLYSSIEDVPHASLLKDCNKAVNRIKQAIENQEKILIVGDYDVDDNRIKRLIYSKNGNERCCFSCVYFIDGFQCIEVHCYL